MPVGSDATATWTHSLRDRGARAARPRPCLFLGLSCEHPLDPGARFPLDELDEVVFGRGDAGPVRTVEAGVRRLTIRRPDRWMSSRHATLGRAPGPTIDRFVLADAGSKNGSAVNGAPPTSAPLVDGDVVELGHTFFLFRCLPDPEADAKAEPARGTLATLSPSLAREFARLDEIARSKVSVVLRGESGTGKEVLARFIHDRSARRGAFVAVNCGALPPNLVESELFGTRKGAFSGAIEDRPGLLRSADRGTLFLDEIGDLPLPAQAALLRVLQEREVHPVGAARPVAVDLRVVCATHRDLEALCAAGDFRADLNARLSGYRLVLPPLRERREDLGLLVATLLRRIAPRPDEVRFSVEAVRALYAWGWPLNVRELEQCLSAAVVLAGAAPIGLEHLPAEVRAPRQRPAAAPEPRLSEVEVQRRDELVRLFEEHGGNLSAVARAAGKARLQIQRWVKRYRIDTARFRR